MPRRWDRRRRPSSYEIQKREPGRRECAHRPGSRRLAYGRLPGLRQSRATRLTTFPTARISPQSFKSKLVLVFGSALTMAVNPEVSANWYFEGTSCLAVLL